MTHKLWSDLKRDRMAKHKVGDLATVPERSFYIAGPMRGLPEFNYPAFHRAEETLRWAYPKAEIFNPARLHNGATDLPLKEYLQPELKWLMKKADTIAFLPGWRGSEGARIEYMVARSIDLDFLFLTPSELSSGDFYDRSMFYAADEWETFAPIEDQAWRHVYGDRNASYGHPSQDFMRTAEMWKGLFGWDTSPEKVAQAMSLLKQSRQTHQKKNDNLVDAIGYVLCQDRIVNGH